MTTPGAPVYHHGAGRVGFLWGYLFLPDQPGRPLELDEASAWVAQADSAASFAWLHFNLADAGARPWIQAHLPVVPEFLEAMQEGSRSTRIEDVGDTLVAVVNDVSYEFKFEPDEIATMWLHVGPRTVVSARVRPLRSIEQLRQAVRQGCRFDSTLGFLNHLLHDQSDVLMRIVRETTQRVDGIEDALLAGRLSSHRAQLGQLRRLLVRLGRLLAPEPAALFRLLRTPPTWVKETDLEEMRQATEEFSLVLRDLAELQERIKLLQEEIAARVGEHTNRSLFTLTMVTVLALPINMVAGLLGMNVGGIPLAEHRNGFVIVALLVVGITVLAAYLVLRRRE